MSINGHFCRLTFDVQRWYGERRGILVAEVAGRGSPEADHQVTDWIMKGRRHHFPRWS